MGFGVLLLLTAGCASAIDGQAVAGTTAPAGTSSEAPDTTNGSTPPTDPVTSEDADPTSETSPSTSLEPIPPVDPTRPATSEPGPDTSEATAPAADPLAAPPFQGSTMVDPASFPGLVTDIGFQSPSGNITCGFYGSDGVVCQIGEYDYSIPPRPDECGDTGWGFNFGVDPQPGGFMFCAGDVEGGGPALAYGQQIASGDYHCVSREEGVTCVNVVHGGGFTLSRTAYELF